MSWRVPPLFLISSLLLLGAVLAGCMDDGVNPERIDGSQLPAHEVDLFINNPMFHPYPGGMLSATAFTEDPQSSQFDPPVIRVTEGQTVRVKLFNSDDLGMNHTIHWHGIHVPWDMDGVPYVTQDPIQHNEEFTYEFEALPAGTHWFHCHVDAPHHLDMGMYGVIIVEPADGPDYEYDREEVLILDSWDSRHIHQTSTDPDMILMSLLDPSGDPQNQLDRTLFQASELYNDPRYPVLVDFYENPLRHERDWYPETFPPWQPEYDTFTINGRSYPYTDPVMIEEGETVKLRLVNVGHSTHAFHIHGHHFKVTHKDGYPLPNAYMADTVLIGPGERYDVLIEGNNPGIWMLHDHVGPHAMNDFIAPGGMKTHLVYEGFHADEMGDDHQHHLRTMRAGDFLGLYT